VPEAVSPLLRQRLERALRTRVVDLSAVEGRGYTHALRCLAELSDGRRVFIKSAVDGMSSDWLRAEYKVYAGVEGSFLPRLVAFLDDELPILVLEDLSDAHWPPPWRQGDVEAVLKALDAIGSTLPPAGVPPVTALQEHLASGWAQVGDDPEPFLGLRLCSRSWLDSALPVLRAAAEKAPLEGDSLLHFDVRSDNIGIGDGRAVLVDWNWACVGNPLFDLAGWLPSLYAEGGPAPERLLPEGAAEFAALLAGYFAAHAGLQPPRTAPRVREVQLTQLRVALPWAARALGIEPPGLRASG
jgi:hypothetical protein